MRLTKQSAYAVKIVTDCAMAQDELVRIAEIAARHRITKHNVAKIVPLLVREKIIESVRGRSGGLRLMRPANDITIGEIVRICENTNLEADCFGGETQDCLVRPVTPINRMLDAALEAFISVLDEHTVEDLASKRTVFMPGSDIDEGKSDSSKTAGNKTSPSRNSASASV